MQPRTAFALAALPMLAACTSGSLARDDARAQREFANLHAVLAAPIADISFENQPLEKVLASLAARHNLNMVVKWRVLQAAGIDKTTPVTIHLYDASLDTALSMICRHMTGNTPVGFVSLGGVLVVSTWEDLDINSPQRLVRQTYDVRDLITLPAVTGPADANRRMVDLMDIILKDVSPNSWRFIQFPTAPLVALNPKPDRSAGFGGLPMRDEAAVEISNADATSNAVISALDTSLIITQTPEVQAEIAEMLEQLRHPQ